MNRHLHFMKAGSSVVFDGEKIKAGARSRPACSFVRCGQGLRWQQHEQPRPEHDPLGAVLNKLGVEFKVLEDILTNSSRGRATRSSPKTSRGQAGYEYAAANFKALPVPYPRRPRAWPFSPATTRARLGRRGGRGKFYLRLSMSPSTGVLMWYAKHARELGIMVRQVEDEIGVINMAIGAAHGGCARLCATSGGGFALMTEALGMSAMIETPVVCINVCARAPPPVCRPRPSRATSGSAGRWTG